MDEVCGAQILLPDSADTLPMAIPVHQRHPLADNARSVVEIFDFVALALLIVSGCVFAAATAMISQLWAYPYARGCLLLILERSIYAAFFASQAVFLTRCALNQLARLITRRPHILPRIAAGLCILVSVYQLHLAYYGPLVALLYCTESVGSSDVCNATLSSRPELLELVRSELSKL